MTYKVGKCLLPVHLQRNRLSQQDFADRIGKTKQTVHKWVDNESIMSYQSALNASKELGCKMEELYEIKVTE